MKVAVVTTHPIQYQVPWFRRLAQAEDLELTVLYCMLPDAEQQGAGFGVAFQWDVPLLDGYTYRVLENVAAEPSVTCFKGCDTPELYSLLRAEPFDAVIVNGWVVKSCLQALHACRRLRIPCIVRGESNALRPRAAWKHFLHRLLLRQYSAFLAIGKSNRQYYLDRGVPAEKICMTPYCVDGTFFEEAVAAAQPDRARYRNEWGIPEEATVFLFVGKFEAKKRPMDMLEALRDVSGNAHLLMVGSGDLLEECRRYAAAHKLPVSFTGFMNQGEIPRAYAVSDAMVLPSDHGETWGLVVNEAMASGLPAIVSDQVGCHPDLIAPGKTGFVYPTGDTQALSEILQATADDPQGLHRMGQAAAEQVAPYHFDQVVEGIREALAFCAGYADKLNAEKEPT